jgi:dTDP-4-dehydrorhamnose reductase
MMLVTGGHGQLGRAIVARAGTDVRAIDIDELDIRDPAQVDRALATNQPVAVIDCAAYTGVDRAEADADAAYAINRDGAANLARACRARSIPVIHVSTDYVFDGSGARPYREDDPIGPVCVYGASKAAGDAEVLAAGGVVVRTSWLFGEGGPSFVHTMMRLARRDPVLRVVVDQHGCPTYAGDLANALLALARRAAGGGLLDSVFHYCNAGATTWHGFAIAIVDELRKCAGPAAVACDRIEPIRTFEYPTPARRPAFSVLDTSRIATLGIVPPHWRDGLRRVVVAAVQESGS